MTNYYSWEENNVWLQIIFVLFAPEINEELCQYNMDSSSVFSHPCILITDFQKKTRFHSQQCQNSLPCSGAWSGWGHSAVMPVPGERAAAPRDWPSEKQLLVRDNLACPHYRTALPVFHLRSFSVLGWALEQSISHLTSKYTHVMKMFQAPKCGNTQSTKLD